MQLLQTNVCDQMHIFSDFVFRDFQNLCEFQRRGKIPPKSEEILTKIASYSAYRRTLLQRLQAPICENVEFSIFFGPKKDYGCVFIFFIFLLSGNRIEPVVLKDRERAQSNGNQKLLSPF